MVNMGSPSQLFIHVYSKTRKCIDSSNWSTTYRDMVVTYLVFKIIGKFNKQVFCFSWMNLEFVTYHLFPDVTKTWVYNSHQFGEIMRRCTDYCIISVQGWA